jgi:hypothetical protein
MKLLPFLLIAATAHASSPPQQYYFDRQGAQYVKLPPYGINDPCDGKIPLEDGKAKLYQNLHDRRGFAPYPSDEPAPVYFLSEASVCKNGKRDGLATRYSYKNNIASESWYRAGELHGTQKYFHDNGKLRHETSFKNGKRHGAAAEYAEDGTVISRVEYAEGTQSGPEFYYNVYTKVSRTQNFVNGNAQGEPEYQSKFTQELLIMAAGAGHLKTVERMLDRGAKPNEPGETEYTSENAVIAAARYSRTEVLVRLLSRGGDVNAYDRYRSRTPLIAAADLGKTDAVRVLLVKGANPNLRGRVGMWRGGGRVGLSVAAPFVWRCPSTRAVAPFPHPAHRTGHADFPHPALGQDFTPSHTPSHAPARGQTYEPVVPVEVLEGIGPAPASPDLVLVAQPPA